jgi:biotin carboxylase
MRSSGNTQTLLLVGGAGAPGMGVDIALTALEQARARGLRVHLTNQKDLIATTRPACDMAAEVSAVDPEDVHGSLAWAREALAAGKSFDVVFSLREFSLVTTAEIAAIAGVAGNSPTAVRRVRRKDECRAWLAAAGFWQPSGRLCRDASEAHAHVRGTRGPWVVKPRDGAGSEGVSLVTDPAHITAAVENLPAESRPFLVEEFVDGAEFSVEGLFLGGQPHVLAITAKEKLPPPFFVEVAHTMPAQLPDDVQRDIVASVTQALAALELRFGPFHVELWVTGRKEIVLGEMHARLGGDYIHRLLEYSIPGIELFGLVYDDALGRSADSFDFSCSRAAATRYLAPPPGKLLSVEGWDAVRDHPSVLVAELNVKPGDMIPPVRSSDDRVGAVVVGEASADKARQLALELAESVRFAVEPLSA